MANPYGRIIHEHRSKRFNGRSGTYNSWRAMKERCDNPKHTSYKNYGARGITYDPRWKSFEVFLNDMGERPEGYELDRKKSKEGYCYENCRWIPSDENRRLRFQRG